MRKILPRTFFDRPTIAVARDLLGKFLVRNLNGRRVAAMITEVEAYDGPNDRASHASRGMTRRTRVMFGEAGVFYIYFTYGMHWLLNIVTGDKGYPAAVLIRGAVIPGKSPARIDGPARLTKFLKIGKKFNERRALPKNRLWFEDHGIKVKKSGIHADKRIGVEYAGNWAKKPYNFRIGKKEFVRILSEP